jgi:hypothetical protein
MFPISKSNNKKKKEMIRAAKDPEVSKRIHWHPCSHPLELIQRVRNSDAPGVEARKGSYLRLPRLHHPPKPQQQPGGQKLTSITKEEFDEFRIDPNYLASRRGGQTVQIPITPKQIISSAELFRKGSWTWSESIPHPQGRKVSWFMASGIRESSTCPTTYVPPTPQDQEVFEMKQIFIYTVLEGKVTWKGKEINRKFEDTRDGQKAYKELTHHHRSSTAASMAARDVVGYLTSVTIGRKV